MKEKLNQYHIAILIYMTQSGVVIFSLPRILAENFGTNGWYVLLICGCIVSFNIFLIQLVYRYGQGKSVFDILEARIPRFVLAPIYVSLALFWAYLGCLVGKQYTLIFQMIAFPTTDPTVFKIVFDILVFLLLTKGIYNISKAGTVFFYLTMWMVFVLFFLAEEFSLQRMTPFFGYGATDGLVGWLEVYTAFLGYEVCLFLFPFVAKKTKFIRAVYIGNLMLTIIYLLVSLLSFGFFHIDQLKILTYPLLQILAYIQLPFVERIESVMFTLFLLKVIMTAVVYFWIAEITLTRVFRRIPVIWIDLFIVSFAFGLSLFSRILIEVEQQLRMIGFIQTAIVFTLPVLLLFLITLDRALRRGESSL